MACLRTQVLARCMRGLVPEAAAVDQERVAACFAAVGQRAFQCASGSMQDGAEADIAVRAGRAIAVGIGHAVIRVRMMTGTGARVVVAWHSRGAVAAVVVGVRHATLVAVIATEVVGIVGAAVSVSVTITGPVSVAIAVPVAVSISVSVSVAIAVPIALGARAGAA